MDNTIFRINKDNGRIEADNVRIAHRNFSGEQSKYNNAGNRNFSLVIPTEEVADMLINDKNKFGVGWNVKIKDALEEGETPFMFMKVTVKFNNGRGPAIFLVSGNSRKLLTEENVNILDFINIERIDLDIRPYDDEINGKPFRSAYLYAMEITQKIDRFTARYDENHRGEEI